MTSNLKIAFRHLWNNKLFSVINILGLALGLASCFIIVLHVKYESGFDRFHVNKDRIIRVVHENYSYTPIVMGNVMPDYFPEIDKVVRVGKFDWTRFYVLKDNELLRKRTWFLPIPVFSTFFPLGFFRETVTGCFGHLTGSYFLKAWPVNTLETVILAEGKYHSGS